MPRIARFVALAFAVALVASLADRAPETASAAPLGQYNYLTNPGFEGAFTNRHDPYSGDWAGELTVAEGWELWYNPDHICPTAALARMAPEYVPATCNPASYNVRPEYKGETGTDRVRSGAAAQKFFTNYSTHTAGFYQVVRNVPLHRWVTFSIWVQTWSSDLDDPGYSMMPGQYHTSVGIDPTGGRDWSAKTIRWSKPYVRHDEWVHLQVSAYTESTEITVWARAGQDWPVKHNDSYWDDAALVVIEAAPTPTPTDTPTPTPAPTPAATPDGYVPPSCWNWTPIWRAGSGGATWGVDEGRGVASVEGGVVSLRNGDQDANAFPLVWVEGPWPTRGDVRLSFRFAFPEVTAAGVSIGVGSWTYEGRRQFLDDPEDPRLHDILEIHHNAGDFRVDLFGRRVWTGAPGDAGWHDLTLEVRDQTHVLVIDGAEVGRVVSHWRPQSLYAGGTRVRLDPWNWTEVSVAHAQLAYRDEALRLPLIRRVAPPPPPTPSPTVTHTLPSPTAAPQTVPPPA